MPKVKIKLGSRSYDILISSGVLKDSGAAVRSALGDSSRRTVVVTNQKVNRLFGDSVLASLQRNHFDAQVFSIGDGERFKSMKTAESLFGFLIKQKLERSDAIIALGGGVVGDLAGFVAATFLRGIRLIQIPTTLLAQIDSSVGGKTAVNHPLGKNLIGAFHQPSLVLVDPETLDTLPPRQVQAGLYEALKYGIILDRRFFKRLTGDLTEIKSLERDKLEFLIQRCCELKARVVEKDERESGLRKILNFGHTIGHALEAVTHYRRFLHGEAVGLGMRGASSIAEQMGMLARKDREAIEDAISSVGKLPSASSLAFDDILSAMHRDKKAEAGRTAFVLPVEIGKVVIRSDVPPGVVRQALKDALA